jgi:hypothetical protein
VPRAGRTGEIDIAGAAMIAYSSEEAEHPVDHLIDGVGEPGGVREALGWDSSVDSCADVFHLTSSSVIDFMVLLSGV